MSNRNIAEELARKYNVIVRQPRYGKDGKWYHHLTKFPAAFLDANGYIVFLTQEDYDGCQYLQLKHDVHVVGDGISSIPGYKHFQNLAPRQAKENRKTYQTNPKIIPPNDEGKLEFTEGAVEEMIVELKKRDSRLRSLAIKKHGTVCQVCGFDFASFYGDLGNGYIEVHHIKPLSLESGVRKMTVADIAIVCANCHRMLHRKGRNAISVQELKGLLQKQG